jgi:hypothetical protein
MALGLLLLGACAAPAGSERRVGRAGRIDWVRLPRFYTASMVLFDRGHATPSDGGYRLLLQSDDGPASAGTRRGFVRRLLRLEVGEAGGQWALHYEVRTMAGEHRYRAVEFTAAAAERTDGRLRGSARASLAERFAGATYDGGEVEVRFDVPIE